MKREHEVRVLVNDTELACLDERRRGLSRAGYVRSLLLEPPDEARSTHQESIAILARMARDGSVTAAVNSSERSAPTKQARARSTR